MASGAEILTVGHSNHEEGPFMRVLHLGPDRSLAPHELTRFAVVEGDHLIYPARQASLGV